MFWEQYVRLCANAGSSPNAVAKAVGIPSGSVTAWKQGTTPRATTVKKIADFFGVSPNYLLFGEDAKKLTDDPEPKKAAAQVGDGLELEFRKKYELLTNDQKKLIEQMIDGLLGARK